jgi:small subunit ribosomal protein S6
MEQKNYRTVFILTPVLSESQMKDAVEKFRKVLKDNNADIVEDNNWGLKKLAYPIQHKGSGFYHLFEFKADTKLVDTLETEYRRDERILRFLTTVLDKFSLDYYERKRKGMVGRKATETSEVKIKKEEND